MPDELDLEEAELDLDDDDFDADEVLDLDADEEEDAELDLEGVEISLVFLKVIEAPLLDTNIYSSITNIT